MAQAWDRYDLTYDSKVYHPQDFCSILKQFFAYHNDRYPNFLYEKRIEFLSFLISSYDDDLAL